MGIKKTADIKLELKTLTPPKLAALMGNVASKLEDNVHFPSPPISPAELKAEHATYDAAITEATEGSLASKKYRDSLTTAARERMRTMANYVRMEAQGREAILSSSGFELAKRSSNPEPTGTPLLYTARLTGKTGQLELRWKAVANRRAYHVFITEEDPGAKDPQWTPIATTGKVRHMVDGLVPYKAYWFCVSAVGALGEGGKSNPMLGRAWAK
jgi:hypothetical protein